MQILCSLGSLHIR